ncbi:MAG: hypothetical protein R3C32_13710 [Chloroflexota bacterium]
MAGVRIVDVLDATAFALVPPYADPRFDHRTCDYWEDADRRSRSARPAWLGDRPSERRPASHPDNPFAPPVMGGDRHVVMR